MRLKTFGITVLLGLMVIAVLSFAQAEPPPDTPGNILDKIAGLQTQITELLGNATEQEQAIHDETAARLNGDQALLKNATEQQNAIDAIVSICPGQCPGGQYVIGIDQDGYIICDCLPPLTLCGSDCVDLGNDEQNCGSCGNVCPPGEKCTGGMCIEIVCLPPLTLCGSDCVDIFWDEQNCGSCGNECGPDEYCNAGRCDFEGP